MAFVGNMQQVKVDFSANLWATLLLVNVLVIVDSSITVQTTHGIVKGKRVRILGETCDLFLGIPYAAPPIGPLRFRNPLPPSNWNSAYDATVEKSHCSQDSDGSEDCLHLNIYRPSNAHDGTDVPVVVWIHGGGFVNGHGSNHNKEGVFMLKAKVIFVSFNYRVGAFGFLRCAKIGIRGNMGLFDQRLALKWIRNNIRSFGGNPNDVTLMGYSAGSASIQYHLMSPESHGLFHKTIMLSGSTNAPWAFQPSHIADQRCSELTQRLECSVDSVKQCLIDAEAVDIVHQSSTVDIEPVTFVFVPTVDGQFIAESPVEYIRSGSVKRLPTIFVTNRDEGSMFLKVFFNKYIDEIRGGYVDAKSFQPIIESLMKDYSVTDGVKLLRMYTENRNILDGYEATVTLSDFIGDKYFLCPLMESMQYSRSNNPLYHYYHFHYVHYHASTENPKWMGVRHNSFLEFMFGDGILLPNVTDYSPEEKKSSEYIIETLSAFIYSRKGLLPDDTDFQEDRYNELDLTSIKRQGHPRQSFCDALKRYEDNSKDDRWMQPSIVFLSIAVITIIVFWARKFKFHVKWRAYLTNLKYKISLYY